MGARSGISHDIDGTSVYCEDPAESKLQSEFSALRTVGLMSLSPAALPKATGSLGPTQWYKSSSVGPQTPRS